jgi:hypothetical protein
MTLAKKKSNSGEVNILTLLRDTVWALEGESGYLITTVHSTEDWMKVLGEEECGIINWFVSPNSGKIYHEAYWKKEGDIIKLSLFNITKDPFHVRH